MQAVPETARDFHAAYKKYIMCRLFKNKTEYKRMLFLWRNKECVVIGRNQIPWVECDVAECHRLGIPILRRFSGGGTVYHDDGNALYSYIIPSSEFSRSKFVKIIADHFCKNGIELTVNERHDILYQGHKVSGSAFRITKDRSYHHGTMLMSTDLSQIPTILNSKLDIEGAWVTSVKSPVTNVPNLNWQRFVKLMSDLVDQSDYHEIDESDTNPDVKKDIELLRVRHILRYFLHSLSVEFGMDLW